MSVDVKLSIKGLQRAQERNLRAIAALTGAGALGRAVKYGSIEAHRYAVSLTHVDTGALKSSHRIEINAAGTRGRIYITPNSVRKPHVYGVYEHRRGGAHAFYARVESEYGAAISQAMGNIVKVGVHGG